MSDIKVDNRFEVKNLEKGKIDEQGDKVYSYKITSHEPENKVLEYCRNNLKLSYYKNQKPNGISPELLEFYNITNFDNGFPNMYFYKVKCYSTS